MWIFPTNYPDKWSADSTNKIFASDWVTNFNITVDEIWDENFSNRSTSDLVEWMNQYFTDIRVTNATQVQQNITDISGLDSDKADKTNVLELDNTTVFTPDSDYEPATKKYVDDSWATFATDQEALEWTATDRVVSVKQVDDNYGVEIQWGTEYIMWEANTERATSSTTMILWKEIECRAWGNFRVSYESSSFQSGGSPSDRNNESQIYKNGVAFWTLNSNTAEYSSPVTYTEDLTFADGDLIQLYYRRVDTWDVNAVIRNMNVKYDLMKFKKYTWTTNID